MSTRLDASRPTTAAGAGSASILVLGGGPDAEREVSLISARAIAQALKEAGRRVHLEEIDRLSQDQLAALPGDAIFPALHGGWGEGGPLQDLLEADGRPFVGSRAGPARHAMDKLATKLTALRLNIPTTDAWILDRRDPACPAPFPVIIKPVHEGSTIGLHICNDADDWRSAREAIEREDRAALASHHPLRSYMIEPVIGADHDGRAPAHLAPARARELTVGILDQRALPVIEIRPADGHYDYQAKYTREDTRYLLDPPLPAGVREKIQDQTLRLARAIGVRHLARADFMLDSAGVAWLLEINTMPGFTSHSLVPMAAAHAGLSMSDLCLRLVHMAVRDHHPATLPR